ncbi:Uncharacterised protein [BD1-7 clade bacterium]|uniref:Carotenoid biosynthesis protein n=1 Tax=BD1-7 clade bacterium TaxID=2029982 RepID=A0A5S9PMS1_9GAMM|nr:Uncharacterised protein [BD1-7 clade bacterium]
MSTTTVTDYGHENVYMNRALAFATILMLVTTGYNLFASHGAENASTISMVASTLAMTGIAILSSLRHLGIKHALFYFGLIVVIELIFEQVNIWTGGQVFGALEYPDQYFGPKIGDVPIAVPLAMCAINWPTYVVVNLILFRKVLVTGKDMAWPMALLHCGILATMHTAWSFCAEPMALANDILERPTWDAILAANNVSDGSTHWGVPWVEFRGWWLMTFLQFFIFNCVLIRFFDMPKPKAFKPLLESAPVVMYFSVALMLVINPINSDMAIGTLFTMITYSALAFFVLFQVAAGSGQNQHSSMS